MQNLFYCSFLWLFLRKLLLFLSVFLQLLQEYFALLFQLLASAVMEIICKNEQDNLVDLKSENDIVVTLKKIEK
jgi:biotin-(acetyl-CoA carboxylase) ligase